MSLEPKGTFFMTETASKKLNKMFHVVVRSFYQPTVEPSNNVFLMYNSDYYEQLYKPDLFDVTLKSFFFRKTFLNKNV